MNAQNPETIIQQAQRRRDKGAFAEALDLAKKANQLDPGHPDPYRIMGQCQRAMGQLAEALKIFEFLSGHFPDDGEILSELALTNWELGKKEEAMQMAKDAVKKDPSSNLCREVLGVLAKKNGYWPIAIECYDFLRKAQPEVIRYHGFLAESYANTHRYEDAARAFARFVKIQGETPENLYEMGMFLFRARLFEEAVPWFEKAARMNPKNEEPVFYLARCHIQFGDLKKGEELVLKALDIKPDSIHTLTLLNELKPKVITREHIDGLFENLKKGQFEGALEKAMTHLFLGKYFHKAKQFDPAFEHFKAANDERFRAFSEEGLRYEPALMEENFNEAKRIFTRERNKKMAGGGSDSGLPILIVSMPRSGTTLLEQIIASHSKVFGAGEVTAMNRIFFDLNYKINLDLEKPVEEVIRENAAEWAGIYLDELRAPKGVLRATDKMPVNFIHLGLFQAMFPNARAIYIRRHPLDTCMSMFSNNLSHSYAYTTRFDHLGHYFNLHAGLMRHWKENLDMKYLEVDYADLVAAPEEKAREILEFCGLEWEDRVLEFYKGRKSAYTISQVQVSEPINKKGLGRWVPYKKYIGPLIETLDEDIVGPLGVDVI